MTDTLFAYLKGAVSNANDTDPETSSSFYNPPMETKHNVLHYSRETVPLDEGDTRTVTIPNYAVTQWVGFMGRVVGEAKLTTVGVNWDGATGTPVTGVTPGYGVERHPGYISAVTTKVTSFTLEGLADGTTVEYIVMTFASDDQL